MAVIARPIGGWLYDRLHPVPVLVWSFAGVAVVQAFQPTLLPLRTIAFLGMASLLGAAAGAVFALVGELALADKVGAVTASSEPPAGLADSSRH